VVVVVVVVVRRTVGGLLSSSERWVEFLIEQLGWQLWFSMLQVLDTADCRCRYLSSLWRLSWFLVDGLRPQVLAVNSLGIFLGRRA
jgi:hypothetical protein